MSERILNPKEKRLIIEEKGYSGELSTLGKITYFTEYFYGIQLTEQDIKKVVPLDNPKDNPSFKEGYQRAMFLVKQGFTKDDYKKYLENINKEIKPKVDNIQIISSIKHR